MMERGAHKELHRHCPAVPVLGHIALFRTLRAFEVERGDTFQTLDNLCFAIEEANNSPKAHQLERAMGDIAIDALRLQIPFLRQGIVSDERERTICAY
jgi:hypothetical protein